MISFTMTEHAQRRSQQRGISRAVINSLIHYGEERWVSGATRYFFTRRALQDAAPFLSRAEVSVLERFSNAYIVVGEEQRVITAARMRRSRHKLCGQ